MTSEGSISKYQTKSGTRWRVRWTYGQQPRYRCPGCNWTAWVGEGLRDKCPDCADPLETGTERRDGHRRGFERMKDAQTFLRDVLGKVDDGSYVRPRDWTVGDYLHRWLDGIRVKPTTHANYRTSLRYVVPRLGALPLQSLTPEHLDGLYRELETSGKQDGTGLATKSVRHVHTALRKALQDAVDRGHLPRNVADLANPPTQKQARSRNAREQAWSGEQVRTFVAHLDDDRHAAAIRLMLATGLRRAELLGLRWSDVDLDAGELRIAQTVTTANGQVVWQGDAKTDSGQRTLALDPETVQVLREHRRAQAAERLAAPVWGDDREGMDARGNPYDPGDLVFTRADGNPYDPGEFTKAVKRRTEAAGLPHIAVHGLRHTYATLALKAGVPVEVLSRRLGHSDPSVTYKIYAHALPGDDEAAARTAATAIFGD